MICAFSAATFFTGGGYKLGEKVDDHQFIPGAESSQSREDRKLDLVLKLWKDGFTIDDGPLRPYHDEESKEFLHAIQKGEIPQVCDRCFCCWFRFAINCICFTSVTYAVACCLAEIPNNRDACISAILSVAQIERAINEII